MAKRKTPGLNTSSMSDISFLLLAFFLMVSSINSDMGIARKLPPPLPDNQDTPEVYERNIFEIKINSHDRLFFHVGGEKGIGHIEELREKAKLFLSNPDNLDNLPQKETMEIEGLGPMEVSKGVISLGNDRGTSYDMYFRVQNELAAAINELKNELSVTKFHKKYADLKDAQRDAIDQAIPVAISEQEPTKIGEQK